jgi:nicotinate phosphoribosyltransferase
LEFGARRAHEATAAVEGARGAVIAGCIGSSNTLAGYYYDLPVLGTMAHSTVQLYDNEYEAFLNYAKHQPHNCTFLVDTYDTLKSGVPNAIRVAKDYLIPKGYRLNAIRLDSGDLAYLAKKARIMLDENGLEDTKIMASNSLDEYLIDDLLNQGAPIDLFGVGENLITAASKPVLGGVYKVVAYEKDGAVVGTIKISDNVEKVTTPGYKKIYRFYDLKTDKAIADLVALADEEISLDSYELFDPTAPWKRKVVSDYRIRALQVEIVVKGELVYNMPSTEEVRKYHKQEMESMWDEVKRLRNPHNYYVDLSQKLFDLKNDLIAYHRKLIEK